MVELQPSKLAMRVRFPPPALGEAASCDLEAEVRDAADARASLGAGRSQARAGCQGRTRPVTVGASVPTRVAPAAAAVTETNAGARIFYERGGFVPTGSTEPLREGSSLVAHDLVLRP
jgi:hypothetical protein